MDNILEDLIVIPSICGEPGPAEQIITYAGVYLQKRGMHVTYYSNSKFPSIMATTHKTREPTVMLVSHLDVMGASPDMFKLRLENGIYYGRGVWDMKCAAAAYMHIVNDLQDNLEDYDFGIMLTTDEETFGDYGTGMLVTDEGYRPKVAILPDAIEPWHIQTFAKGCTFAEISVAGVNAHGSRPWEGDSASFKLIDILHEVKQLFGQQPDTATLNIGAIRTGEMSLYNKIPDQAVATLDMRYLDHEQIQMLHRQIIAICDHYGATFKTIGTLRDAVHNDIDDPYIQKFLEHATRQRGITPKPIKANGTSDARFFSRHNIPCILTSPKGGGFHGDGEWLDATDYEEFKILIRTYLDDVAKDKAITRADALTFTT